MTYLPAISSFILSARSASGFGCEGFPVVDGAELRTVSVFAFAAVTLALMLEGERGRSGEPAILSWSTVEGYPVPTKQEQKQWQTELG